MSTSDLSVPAGLAPPGTLGVSPESPISDQSLRVLAEQALGSADLRGVGPDGPPQVVPPAPRGGGWDGSAATSAAHTAGNLAPGYVPSVSGSRQLDLAAVPDLRGVGPLAEPSRPAPTTEGAPEFSLLRERAPQLAPERATVAPPVAPPPEAPATAAGRPIFDVETVRRDFPILSERVNGAPLIWLDNAATTQKPRAVIDRLTYFYEHENSNIHRAAHELAARATDAYEDARQSVRRFLGAAKDEEIIFVRGTTEGINLVAHSWGRHNLRRGDEIVITHLEHHANIVPWQMIARQTGAVLKVAPVDDRGNLLMEEFADLLGPRTKLVAATHVSNALGTVTPVDQIVELGHRVGARVLIDGAQSVPHLSVDLRRLGADFFTFSGHKIFGPTGIGVLYISERVWDETPAWQGGGNMIEDVTLERSVYQGPPNKYEAGTGNIADAVGLGEALKYVERLGIDRMAAWEESLLAYATPRLAAVPGVRIIGTADHKASVLSFVLAGHDPLEIGQALNEEGIAVRAGHHCAQPILRRLGLEATVRPSFAFYNTLEEADTLIAAVRRIAERSHRI